MPVIQVNYGWGLNIRMSANSIFSKRYFYYSLVLFITSLSALFFAYDAIGLPQASSPTTILFFLVLSVYTISVGYPHPNFGHVSFDRVGQVASVLVLGPVMGAIITGASSLIYPIHRLWKGVALQDVVIACLHNAGLMTLTVLGGGLFYHWLGGTVPLQEFDLALFAKLAAVTLVMQIINEAGMFVYLLTRDGDPTKVVNRFSTGVEIASGFIGVLVALVFSRLEMGIFILLLVILSLGMFVLRRFAIMRNHLELLVAERTAELQRKSEELERKATHDKLTGLYNRRYADDYLEREIEAALRYQENFTIALADIDHFKKVNDHYSHEIGDRVLKRVATVLRDSCRTTDTIARYGGEEFLLCFPRTNANDALGICEKLRLAIESCDWTDLAPNMALTISFGIAQIDVNSRRKSILREADKHLYAAKNLGRNRVVA